MVLDGRSHRGPARGLRAPPTPGTGAVDTLRDSLVPATLGSIDGADVGVGGDTASDVDFTSNLERATPIVLLVVLALTFAVMLVAFRSLAVPA